MEQKSGAPLKDSNLRYHKHISNAVLLLVALICSTILGACQQPPPQKGAASAAPAMPTMPVAIELLRKKRIIDSTTYVARLVTPNFVTLRPQISGYITKIFRKAGDNVTVGTPLLEVNPDKQVSTLHVYEAAASSAKSDKENAQQTLEALQFSRASQVSSLAFDKAQFERYKDLYEQEVVSEEEMQRYATQLSNTQAGLQKIDAQIRAQQATIASNEKSMQQATDNIKSQVIQLGYYTIKAPMAGIVGDIPVKIGDYVDSSTELTTLTRNQPLEVCINVPASRGVDVKPGLPVELLNNDGKPAGQARVFFISSRVDPETQTLLIKALYTNDRLLMRTGQSLKVRIVWDAEPRLAVPINAVNRIAEQDFVYIAEGSGSLTAKLKPVQLGPIRGQDYEVVSGVKPGEKLIVSGIQTLADGMPVKPQYLRE